MVKDDEVEAVMKKAGVGLLEAAEAMERCSFQPRKALAMLDSQKRAREQAEKAEKKAREQQEAEAEEAERNARKAHEAKAHADAKKKSGGEEVDSGAAGVDYKPQSAFPSRDSSVGCAYLFPSFFAPSVPLSLRLAVPLSLPLSLARMFCLSRCAALLQMGLRALAHFAILAPLQHCTAACMRTHAREGTGCK